MIPYKYNKLFTEVSEELSINEDLVDRFITFYYKEIRKHLSELSHTRLNIDGLGQFMIKPKSVSKLINRYEKSVESSDDYSFASYFNKKRLESRLEDLNKIQQKIEEEANKKRKFLEEKYGSKS